MIHMNQDALAPDLPWLDLNKAFLSEFIRAKKEQFTMKTWSRLYLVALFTSSTISAMAQDYRIDWHTISGGGGTSSGGPHTLRGPVGPPGAGTPIDEGYM